MNKRCGKITIIGDAPESSQGLKRVVCMCDCGKELTLYLDAFKSGRITSCGCGRRQEPINANNSDSKD